jgi:hypothetical protein
MAYSRERLPREATADRRLTAEAKRYRECLNPIEFGNILLRDTTAILASPYARGYPIEASDLSPLAD